MIFDVIGDLLADRRQLDAEIDSQSDDPASLSHAEREVRVAEAMGDLLQTERDECALTWRAQSEGLPASFVPTSRRSHCWASRWSRLHAPPFRAPPEDTPSMSCSRKASGDEHRYARVCSAGPSAGRVLRVISSV
jgi:hypothetical protein